MLSSYVRIVWLLLIGLGVVSCGSSTAPKLSEVVSSRHVVLFKGVSKNMLEVFSNYYTQKDKWVNISSKDSCENLGFEYVNDSDLKQQTKAKTYVDARGVYACFEIYTTSSKYAGEIDRALTLKGI